MNKRVNDIRRVILALCFFGLVLSLLGTELPWVKISQSKAQNPVYIIDKPTCNITQVAPAPTYSNGSTGSPVTTDTPLAPTITELEFTNDVYLTLSSSQLCQTFTKGSLPSPISANLKDIRMCTDTAFDQISNFMVDVKAWDSYSSDCKSAGTGTFACIILSLIVISITMLINTFPKLTGKCCNDINSKKNKIIRSFVSVLAPLFVTLGLVTYTANCLNGDIGNVLTKRKMSRGGDGGYFLCCISCAALWVYWVLFVWRMCDNDVPQIDFKAAGDMKAKFLRKKKKETDVDAGMMTQEQENQETMGSDPYNPTDHDDNQRKISAYDDGDNNRKISAYDDNDNTWRDVEED